MKSTGYIMRSAMVLIIVVSSCKSNMNTVKEEEAIKALINAETQAWIDRDPDQMKKYYIQDEYQTRLNIQDSIYSITIGWDKRSPAIDTLTKYADWVGVEQFRVQKEFLIIKVKGNTAWAILKETQNMIYYGSPATAESIIHVMLEKEKKEWKISCFVKSSI